MAGWFSNDVHDSFEFLSTSHIVVLFIFLIGIVYLFSCYRLLSKQSTLYQLTRWIFFGLLVLSELTYQVWTIGNGIWSFREYVPLHLCGVASLLGMYALVTHNKHVVQALYFIGIIPAALALLTPDLLYTFPHFTFMKFFIHHMTIVWTSVFLILTSQTAITFRSLMKVFGSINVYAVLIFFINRQLGSNYLYLSQAPSVNTPLGLLGDGVWYYVNLELLAFSVFLVMFFVYKLVTRNTASSSYESYRKSVISS